MPRQAATKQVQEEVFSVRSVPSLFKEDHLKLQNMYATEH
jgi:hypothetical protein